MKRLISMLLALCMVLTLAPAVFAAGEDEDVRETDFFEDQPHSDLLFSEMEYKEVTEEQFMTAIDDTEALIEENAAVAKIEDAFHVVTDLLQALESNMTILNIKTSADVTDEESQDLYMATYEVYMECYDPFIALVQDILESKAADKIIKDDMLTQDDIDYYVNYGGMSDEEKALSSQLAALDNEYDQAYFSGDLNAVTKVYMKSIDLNKKLAALYPEYDSYADYAYSAIYGRDYTTQEAREFFDAVKRDLAPLAMKLYFINDLDTQMDPDGSEAILVNDYTTKETLDTVRPYIARLSSELLETWDYMVDHELYDIDDRENKYPGGFTTLISGFGAPFFFNSPYGDLYDFTTIVHEFGHYSNYYWHPHIWNEGVCSFDVAEVHSQALELLFSNFYEDIFGGQAQVAEGYLFSNIFTSGIINGALVGELELYAYETPDVTLDMIDAKYKELCEEYGLSYGRYNFVTIPHMTRQPMYYISYATSAIGALTFWNISQEEGMEKAVDDYLKFMSLPYYTPFQDEFSEVCGVNPMDPDYIAEIAENVSTAFNVDERFQTVLRLDYFSDVTLDDWFFEDVCSAFEDGLMKGKEEGAFDPNGTLSRAEAATVLWNLDGNTEPKSSGNFTDTEGTWYEDVADWAVDTGILHSLDDHFNGAAPVSREEIAFMIYNYALYTGEDVSVTSTRLNFPDAKDVDSWALVPMVWCVEQGIFQGDGDGALKPDDTITRAAMASVMERAVSGNASEETVTVETPDA